jgi:hypothetical protein
MADTTGGQTYWQTIKVEGEAVVEKLKQLIHEGNVSRVVIKHNGRTVAEFPLTAGVLGAVIAPVLAAIAALVAVLKDCTIEIERENRPGSSDEETRAAS